MRVKLLSCNVFLFTLTATFAVLSIMSSCVTTGKLKDGETAYRLGNYSTAVDMLSEEFNGTKNPVVRSTKAWQLGQSYAALNNPEKSTQWFKAAYDEGFGPQALYEQAQQLKKQESFEGAIAALKLFLKEDPDRRPEINREIAACNRAIQWKEGTHYYVVENAELLNSPAEDFSPVFFENNELVFTSGRSSASGEKVSEWTGGKYYDLFSSKSIAGNFVSPSPFDLQVNGIFYEGAATFSSDYSEMVYTQCGSPDKQIDDACRLLYRFREPDGTWSSSELLDFFLDSVNIGHPALSPNGKRLYFSAAGDPDGYGGADIYYVKQTDEGWGSPINLGPGINTERNEVFPFIAKDDKLYFSSDGHPGMGGLDIWTSTESRKKWARPENLGYPLNSGSDDFGVALVERAFKSEDTLAMGYFSSSRPGGKGSDDIYQFILEKTPPPPPLYLLKGEVVGVEYENPKNPNSLVKGYKPLPNTAIKLMDKSSGINQGSLALNKEAKFETIISFATDYEVSGTLKEWFTSSVEASTMNLPNNPGDTIVVETRLVLEPIIEVDISLKNIYYDFGDTVLRPESYPELGTLVKLLNDNPTLLIEIGSHTDSRGDYDFNEILSRGRANSVVSYLLSRGIGSSRLIAEGYGERRLLNGCKDSVECTEEEHQLNRRTTFKVLGEIELESEVPDDIRVDPKN
ncbi:MAG: peptidoglycan-associated lipoprotein [Limisphaerales bacterium]|jgi:peptidoglycan-associated lipoprotein